MNNLQTLHFETVQAPDSGSMYMDRTLLGHLARITVGQVDKGHGYCDTEVLNTETEETVRWQHQEFGIASDLRDLPGAQLSTVSATFMLPLADQNVRLNSLLEPLLAAAGG